MNIKRVRGEFMTDPHGPANGRRPAFRNDISLGQIITMAVMLLALGGSIMTFGLAQENRVTKLEERGGEHDRLLVRHVVVLDGLVRQTDRGTLELAHHQSAIDKMQNTLAAVAERQTERATKFDELYRRIEAMERSQRRPGGPQ